MSNTLIVTLVEQEPLTRRHAGEHKIEVLATEVGAGLPKKGLAVANVEDFLIEHLAEIRFIAAKEIAATRVPYPEAGGSDSDYLDRRDAVADCFFFKDVRVVGVDTRLYEVDGQYSPNFDNQAWTDVVEAGDETEAFFQARLELARLEGWEIVDDVTGKAGAEKCLEALLSHLCEFEINSAVPLADLAETLLRELVEAAEAGEDVDDIIEKLKTEGRRILGDEPVAVNGAMVP